MGEICGHLVLRGTGTDLLLEAAAPVQCEVTQHGKCLAVRLG